MNNRTTSPRRRPFQSRHKPEADMVFTTPSGISVLKHWISTADRVRTWAIWHGDTKLAEVTAKGAAIRIAQQLHRLQVSQA